MIPLKPVAIFVLICFTANSLAYAAPISVSAAAPQLKIRTSPREARRQSLLEELAIPGSLGRIETKYLPEQNSASMDFPAIVHIQDAHSSYEAQKKIQELLRYLQRHYGFELILAEGAEGRLEPDLLRPFTEERLNNELADRLAKHFQRPAADLGASLESATSADNFSRRIARS